MSRLVIDGRENGRWFFFIFILFHVCFIFFVLIHFLFSNLTTCDGSAVQGIPPPPKTLGRAPRSTGETATPRAPGIDTSDAQGPSPYQPKPSGSPASDNGGTVTGAATRRVTRMVGAMGAASHPRLTRRVDQHARSRREKPSPWRTGATQRLASEGTPSRNVESAGPRPRSTSGRPRQPVCVLGGSLVDPASETSERPHPTVPPNARTDAPLVGPLTNGPTRLGWTYRCSYTPRRCSPVDHGGTQAPSPRQDVRLGGGSTTRR